MDVVDSYVIFPLGGQLLSLIFSPLLSGRNASEEYFRSLADNRSVGDRGNVKSRP